MQKILATLLAATMVAALAACGSSGSPSSSAPSAAGSTSAPASSASEEPTSSLSYVAIGAGATGGNFYMTTSTFAQAYNDKVPGTTCNAETTSGSTENCKMILDGDLQMAIANVDSAYCASTGTREFNEGHYAEGGDIVVVFPGAWNNFLNIIVRADSGITDISQLKGKTVACNSGSQMTDYTPLLMKSYGMEPGEYTINAVTTSEMADAMRDKQVDAIIQFGAAPSSAFADLASTTDVLFLEVDDAHVDQILAEFPYFNRAQLPAGSYKGQDAEVQVLANMPVFIALADLDEGFVYQFVKCIVENGEELEASYANARFFNLESLKDYHTNGALKLHSGAIRYLKDVGAI